MLFRSVMSDIVTIPYSGGDYSVDLLGMNAGWLEGTALPGAGPSIIAAHNTLDADEYGPFALLLTLEAGDVIVLSDQRSGEMTRFTVYANELIAPDGFADVEAIAGQEENALALLTCENESAEGGYQNRRAVFAKPAKE